MTMTMTMTMTARATIVVGLAAFLMACGSSATPVADAGDAAADPSDSDARDVAASEADADANTGADAPDANTDSGSEAASPTDADAAPRVSYGAIVVELKDIFTSFLATFFDAAPLPLALDTRQTVGDCVLRVPRTVTCPAACATDTTCVGVGVCAPVPRATDIGTLHVEGLGATAVDLETTSPQAPSYQIVPTLPPAACAEGAVVKAGGATFSASTTCITDLVVTSHVPLPVTTGQAMHVAWTPPAQTSAARVQLELEISHHGGFRGQINCDVADTGAFDIPAALVSALVDLGRAGYPTIKLARVSSATAPEAPGVSLTIASRVQLDVDTGVISCGADESPPCATGTVCRTDYTCGPP